MIEIKSEETDDLLDLSAQPEDYARHILKSINIDPALLSQPLPATASAIDSTLTTFPSEQYKLDRDTTSSANLPGTSQVLAPCADDSTSKTYLPSSGAAVRILLGSIASRWRTYSVYH